MRWFWGRAEEGKREVGERETLLAKIFGEDWSENMESKWATIISNFLQIDVTIHCQWVPQSHPIYHHATENWNWIFGNSLFLFSVSIILTQIFEFWVMETSLKKQAKQDFFGGTHKFWTIELWKLSDITQLCGFPNRKEHEKKNDNRFLGPTWQQYQF